MRKTLPLLLALLISLGSHAQNFDFQHSIGTNKTLYFKILSPSTVGLTYPNYVSNNYYSGYTKPKGHIAIPSTVTHGGTTYTVTSITFNAFYQCDSITSVTIPASVTSVGDYAFYGCSEITNLDLGSGVTTIGQYAFYGNHHITELTIPRQIASMAKNAFMNCGSLRTVNFNADSCRAMPSKGWGFNDLVFSSTPVNKVNFGSHVKYIPANAFKDRPINDTIVIPSSVRSIGDDAFSGCSLDTIVWGSNIDTIGSRAFENNRFSVLNLPASVKVLKGNAFIGNNRIKILTIPSNIERIEYGAFTNWSALTRVNFLADSCVDAYSSGEWFYNCSQMTYVHIGENVKAIPAGAFKGTRITGINIPNSVKRIGTEAFANCSELQGVVMGNGVREIERKAFQSCSKLSTLNIGSSVENIGEQAFYGCKLIKSITLPSQLKTIGSNAFGSCDSLKTVYFNADSCLWAESETWRTNTYPVFSFTNLSHVVVGSNVKAIPNNLFRKCSSINSITLPNGLSYIGSRAFEECTGIVQMTLPNTVKKIGDLAFMNCTSMTNISLGNSLESIGANVFSNDSSLTSLALPESLDSIGDRAFSYCTRIPSVTIPRGLQYLKEPFPNCTSLTSVVFNADSCTNGGSYSPFTSCPNLVSATFGDNVKSIPHHLFYNCTNLANVSLPDSVGIIGTYAFYSCSTMTSITIPPAVTEIGRSAFSNCNNLDTVFFNADSCMNMWGNYYYSYDKNFHMAKHLILGSNVKGLSEIAFRGCPLESIVSYSNNPPLVNNAFWGMDYSIPVYVPCTAILDYQQAPGWSSFTNYQMLSGDYSMHVASDNSEQGAVEYLASPCETGQATVQAVPANRFRFVGWSDGSTDNPRTLTLTHDTVITATFEPDTFIVSAAALPSLRGTIIGGGTYYRGDTATIYAFPTGGFVFDNWNGNATDNPLRFPVDKDTLLSASFSLPPTDTVTVHDTTYIDVFIHDTTRIDVPVHDTTYITLTDTLTVLQTDTVTITVVDTLTIHSTDTITVYNTDTLTVHTIDTLTVYNTDTLIVHQTDTLVVYQTDTLYLTDTLYIDRFVHDTVYITDTVYVGVDDVKTVDVKLYQQGGDVVVEGAEGQPVAVYDAVGRLLATRRDTYGPVRFAAPAAGTYLVRVGSAAARRIVVVR